MEKQSTFLMVIICIGVAQFVSMMVITKLDTPGPDPMCVLSGNISCYMHCNGMGYLSGFCDKNDTCCCLDDIEPPCICIQTTVAKQRNPENRCDLAVEQSCAVSCKNLGHASHVCEHNKCRCF